MSVIRHFKMTKVFHNASIKDYEIGRPLGRGAFGRVYLARTKKEQFIVALKVLFKKSLLENHVEQNLRREIEINARIKHPNILQMYGCFWDNVSVYLVLEYAPNGELFKRLMRMGHFNEPDSASYVAELCEALIYCHSRNIIHRDIKPENLLLGGYGELKLADFGWSAHAPSSKRRTVCGTTDYLAPELVKRVPYDASIDIWCTGILLYEFMVGSPPFETKPHGKVRSEQELIKETHNKIRTCKYQIPEYVPADPARLITAMLKEEGKDRLPLETLLKDVWIKKNRLLRDKVVFDDENKEEKKAARDAAEDLDSTLESDV
ncbi:aurora kinase C-like [Paramacrobiotus metropolitanus]|uniref:aurora kinase C-like n=1 Tax=Paramacrobiotus metropolitanus TaxID=2943436 RepID=UPI002446342B|nr:aurora kinase C-like [Paramacrobiotus metropolitanus]